MFTRNFLQPAMVLLVLLSLVGTLMTSASPDNRTSQRPEAIKFDEFGPVHWNDLRARLDDFAVQIHEQAPAYIIVYAARNCSRPGEAINLGKYMKGYLVNKGVTATQVTTVDGGFRNSRSSELWLVPLGAANPKSTPTVSKERARVSSKCPGLGDPNADRRG